jgi:hypothetical protein
MRATLALCVIGLSMLPTGCALVGSAAGHVASKAKESLDDCRERARDRQWAEAAWNGFRCARPDVPYSDDYADGFKEGFADYLYAGGSGEPPALPPRRYRTSAYQTPRGYQAIEEWFAGYRAGAAVARDGDFRRWITGPTSLRGPDAALPLPAPPPEPVPQKLPAPPPPEPVPQKLPESLPPEPLPQKLPESLSPPGKVSSVPDQDEAAPPGEAQERSGNVGWWYFPPKEAHALPAPPPPEPASQQPPEELPPPGRTQQGPGKAGSWYVPPSLEYLPKP